MIPNEAMKYVYGTLFYKNSSKSNIITYHILMGILFGFMSCDIKYFIEVVVNKKIGHCIEQIDYSKGRLCAKCANKFNSS